MEDIKHKLTEVAVGKVLRPTNEPDFFVTEWEKRSNGAMVATIYTYTPHTGPIATPVVWMQGFEDSPEAQIERGIQRIKKNDAYGS